MRAGLLFGAGQTPRGLALARDTLSLRCPCCQWSRCLRRQRTPCARPTPSVDKAPQSRIRPVTWDFRGVGHVAAAVAPRPGGVETPDAKIKGNVMLHDS